MKHYYQLTKGVRNGCGPANVGHLVSDYDALFDLPLIEIANRVGNSNGFTHMNMFKPALNYFGIQNETTNRATISWYEQKMREGVAVIALVAYDQFSKPRPLNYEYAHFITVVAIDDEFVWAHDPLRPSGPTAFPREEFIRAISVPSRGPIYDSKGKKIGEFTNFAHQAVYPLRAPVRNPIVTEIKEGIQKALWLLE